MSGYDDTTVVVLAGGRGTRLQGLFPDVPKPLIPVAGQPFLYWLTRWLAHHGPKHFVYSTGYMADQVEAWSQDSSLPGIERICRPETQPLGTGGGLLNGLDLYREWILVANGDGLVMAGIDDLLAMRTRAIDGAMLGVAVPDTSRFGSLVVDPTGRLTGYAEKVPGRGLINGGLYLFRKTLLEQFYRPGVVSIETDLFPAMLESGAFIQVVARHDAPFIDIGTPETVRQAAGFVTAHFARD